MINKLATSGNNEFNQVATSMAPALEQNTTVAQELPVDKVFSALNASRFQEEHYNFKIPFGNVEFEIYGSSESQPFLTINVKTKGTISYSPMGYALQPIAENKVTDEHRSSVEALMKQLLQEIPEIIRNNSELIARELAKAEN